MRVDVFLRASALHREIEAIRVAVETWTTRRANWDRLPDALEVQTGGIVDLPRAMMIRQADEVLSILRGELQAREDEFLRL